MSYEKCPDHRAVAEEGATGAERVRDDVEGRDLGRLQVKQRSPRRVAVDLQRVVRRAVEEEREVWVDDDGLERDDARRLGLEAEPPCRGVGRGTSEKCEERQERDKGWLHLRQAQAVE